MGGGGGGAPTTEGGIILIMGFGESQMGYNITHNVLLLVCSW